jgi:hypothetical protein
MALPVEAGARMTTQTRITASDYRHMNASPAKRSKYGVRTDARGKAARTVDGILFASFKEAKHYVVLKQLERTKQITHLVLQPRFPLLTCRASEYLTVAEYRGDFAFFDAEGNYCVHDVKGMDTDMSKLKRKWLKLQTGIDVVIV